VGSNPTPAASSLPVGDLLDPLTRYAKRAGDRGERLTVVPCLDDRRTKVLSRVPKSLFRAAHPRSRAGYLGEWSRSHLFVFSAASASCPIPIKG
jgi:hypothetical protein